MRGVLPVVTLTGGVALACSGPGAEDAIATSSLIGLVALVVSFGTTIGSVMRVRKLQLAKAAAVVAVVLLALHPTVWLGVSSGDCGYTIRYAAPIVAAIHVGVLGFLMTRVPSKAP